MLLRESAGTGTSGSENIGDLLSVESTTGELIAGAGFDWILLDTEHSPNDVTDILGHLQAGQAGTASLIVRPAWNDMVLIKRYLDIGAQTLLLPFVQSVPPRRTTNVPFSFAFHVTVAPTLVPPLAGPRMTMGTLIWPPDM